jgi:hypothetical protein
MKVTKRFFGVTFASIVIWIGGSAITPNPLYAESLVGVTTYYNPDFGPNGGAAVYALTDDGYLYKYDTVDGWDDPIGNYPTGDYVGVTTYYNPDFGPNGGAVVYALTDDGYLYKYDTVDGWDDPIGDFGPLGPMVGASTFYYTTDHTIAVVYGLRVEGYLYRYETDFGFEYLGTWFLPDHIAQGQPQVTASIQLHPCYPNPFNPVSTIPFTVRRSTKVRLSVFNLLGEQVALLKDEVCQPGECSIVFDGTDLAAGVYIYTLSSGELVLSGKLTLLK